MITKRNVTALLILMYTYVMLKGASKVANLQLSDLSISGIEFTSHKSFYSTPSIHVCQVRQRKREMGYEEIIFIRITMVLWDIGRFVDGIFGYMLYYG
uniref:Uncharacterized protein n=1 Tax=Glossina palpalis gambiensis TaxID=67801 RepID=A0A1B0BCB4_9MUSC